MAGNASNSRLERVYLQKETTYGIIPGQAAGNQVVHNVHFQMTNDTPLIPREDKTGSRGMIAGAPGRVACRWNGEFGLTGGTRMDPLLAAAFGAGTAGNYQLGDEIGSFTAWSYRRPSTIEQRVAHGLVVSECVWNLGQDQQANWTAQGEGQYVLGSDLLGTADATALGGIVAMNPEPVPVYSDTGLIIGFTGLALFDGNPIASIRTAQIRLQTGNRVVRDQFGDFYGSGTEGAVRNVGIQFSCYDTDEAAITNLRTKAASKAPIQIVLTVGITGNQWVFTLNNVQLGSESLSDQQIRWVSDWSEGRASETTSGANDELTITHTT